MTSCCTGKTALVTGAAQASVLPWRVSCTARVRGCSWPTSTGSGQALPHDLVPSRVSRSTCPGRGSRALAWPPRPPSRGPRRSLRRWRTEATARRHLRGAVPPDRRAGARRTLVPGCPWQVPPRRWWVDHQHLLDQRGAAHGQPGRLRRLQGRGVGPDPCRSPRARGARCPGQRRVSGQHRHRDHRQTGFADVDWGSYLRTIPLSRRGPPRRSPGPFCTSPATTLVRDRHRPRHLSGTRSRPRSAVRNCPDGGVSPPRGGWRAPARAGSVARVVDLIRGHLDDLAADQIDEALVVVGEQIIRQE